MPIRSQDVADGRDRNWRAAAASLLLIGCDRPAEAPPEAPPADAVEPSRDSTRQPQPKPAPNGKAPAARGNVSACLVQDGTRLPENALRGIGTEPFWAVEVQGRCVTYSTPEDQAGTRVWTRFEGTAQSGRWSGALDGSQFVMVTQPKPGCSDGMSDNLYPIAVTLTVRGEQRSGCAEPRSISAVHGQESQYKE